MILKIDNHYINYNKIEYFTCFIYLNNTYNLHLFIHLNNKEKLSITYEINNEKIGKELKETNGFLLMKNLFKYLNNLNEENEEITDLNFILKYLINNYEKYKSIGEI